jgi:O-methyltransferase
MNALGSKLSSDRIDSILMMCALTQLIPGAIADLGAHNCAVTEVIASNNTNKKVYAFDTFTGIPAEQISACDSHAAGEFASSIEIARGNLAKFENAIIIDGVFPNTTNWVDHELRWSFVHVDLDTYLGTMHAMQWFYPRMSRGGIMAFDDYQWFACKGVTLAIDEFFNDKPEKIFVSPITKTCRVKQAFFIKS